MTDQQFKTIVAHLQVMIGILGPMAGVLVALAWEDLADAFIAPSRVR